MHMKSIVALSAPLIFGLLAAGSLGAQPAAEFRPPAVPLVTSDPYLSIWSEANHLTDDVTRHWTHSPNALVSLIRIDGATYRLMGNAPANVPALPQTGLQVTPTRSIYDFDDGHVHITLTFMTPALPDDLDVLTRPATYLTWAVKSSDGKNHSVSLYDSTSSVLAVNVPENAVTWARETAGPLTALKAGAAIQTLFAPRGDGTRINWGYAYAAAPTDESTSAIGGERRPDQSFVSGGILPATDDTPPRAANDHEPVLAFVFDLGSVGAETVSRGTSSSAYDEIHAINFPAKSSCPYWKRNGATMARTLPRRGGGLPQLVLKCANVRPAISWPT